MPLLLSTLCPLCNIITISLYPLTPTMLIDNQNAETITEHELSTIISSWYDRKLMFPATITKPCGFALYGLHVTYHNLTATPHYQSCNYLMCKMKVQNLFTFDFYCQMTHTYDNFIVKSPNYRSKESLEVL